VSFESDSRLRRTKERLHRNCLPCLTGLLEQLKGAPDRVELTFAWDCWKVVALTKDHEECLALLDRFASAHPEEYVYGKLGTGRADRETHALIFHTESAERRDELLAMLRELLAVRAPECAVFHSRGCGNPYEELLGPWQAWERISTIRHPERVPAVREGLRESLYGSRR
jgi:hypothetical protein